MNSNFARIVGEMAVDVSTNPAIEFHPDLAAEFVAVPADVERGWRLIEGEWTAPPAPEPVEPVEPQPIYRTKLSRPEFKLQFTSAERIAIRAARDYAGEDTGQLTVKAVLDDFFDIVEDPALTFVDLELPATIEGVAFLETAGLITAARVGEILAGLPE